MTKIPSEVFTEVTAEQYLKLEALQTAVRYYERAPYDKEAEAKWREEYTPENILKLADKVLDWFNRDEVARIKAETLAPFKQPV